MNSNEKIIPLKFPLTSPDGTIIREIRVTRIKARHLKGMDVDELKKMDGILKLIGEMNLLPQSVVDELDMVDIGSISEAMSPFLGDTGGGTPAS